MNQAVGRERQGAGRQAVHRAIELGEVMVLGGRTNRDRQARKPG